MTVLKGLLFTWHCVLKTYRNNVYFNIFVKVLFNATPSSTQNSGKIILRKFLVGSIFSTGSMSKLNCKRLAAWKGVPEVWMKKKKIFLVKILILPLRATILPTQNQWKPHDPSHSGLNHSPPPASWDPHYKSVALMPWLEHQHRVLNS